MNRLSFLALFLMFMTIGFARAGTVKPEIKARPKVLNRNEKVLRVNAFLQEEIITVGAGGTYETLDALFLNEPEGEKLIILIDNEYHCTNPYFVIKEGWTIQGKGIGKTKLFFTFTVPINPGTSGLHIRQNCRLQDFEVVTINNTNTGGYSQYALHGDYPSYPLKAVIERCSFKTAVNPDQPDANGWSGLSVGIGTWEGQVLEFHDCFIESAGVSLDNKYSLNLHNTYISGLHTLPSRVSYYNCILTGGFTTVLISDVYSNDSEPNQDRIQDLFEFVGCEIKGGLWIRSYSQLGTIPKKNGILYNFSGTSVDEFISVKDAVDTSLPNYGIKSLPVTDDIGYLRNLGTSTISAGDFVSYVYGTRLPEYHLPATETITTIIGVEKLSPLNIQNFAGISLVTSAANKYLHFAAGAIAYTSATSLSLTIGDNVTFDDSGNLIRAWFGGIGVIRKKTYDNRLGIELNSKGARSNNIGSYSARGVLQIKGKAATTGAPDLEFDDDGYVWGVSNGTNRNTYAIERGRLSINDMNKGLERFGISTNGMASFTGGVTVAEPAGSAEMYTKLIVGNDSKPSRVGLGTYNPQQNFVVSNKNKEGFEIALHDFFGGKIYLQTYNRTSNTYTPLQIDASETLLGAQGPVKSNDTIEITNPSDGLILTDTVTGTRYIVRVTNGSLTLTALP